MGNAPSHVLSLDDFVITHFDLQGVKPGRTYTFHFNELSSVYPTDIIGEIRTTTDNADKEYFCRLVELFCHAPYLVNVRYIHVVNTDRHTGEVCHYAEFHNLDYRIGSSNGTEHLYVLYQPAAFASPVPKYSLIPLSVPFNLTLYYHTAKSKFDLSLFKPSSDLSNDKRKNKQWFRWFNILTVCHCLIYTLLRRKPDLAVSLMASPFRTILEIIISGFGNSVWGLVLSNLWPFYSSVITNVCLAYVNSRMIRVS